MVVRFFSPQMDSLKQFLLGKKNRIEKKKVPNCILPVSLMKTSQCWFSGWMIPFFVYGEQCRHKHGSAGMFLVQSAHALLR